MFCLGGSFHGKIDIMLEWVLKQDLHLYLEYRGVQWSTIEYSGVQASTVEYSRVQGSTREYRGVQ